jgi:hypothetical protein
MAGSASICHCSRLALRLRMLRLERGGEVQRVELDGGTSMRRTT